MMRADSIESVKVLRGCFSDREWIWLQEQPAFTQAMRDVTSLDDVDLVCRLGCELIRTTEAIQSANRLAPNKPDNPGAAPS